MVSQGCQCAVNLFEHNETGHLMGERQRRERPDDVGSFFEGFGDSAITADYKSEISWVVARMAIEEVRELGGSECLSAGIEEDDAIRLRQRGQYALRFGIALPLRVSGPGVFELDDIDRQEASDPRYEILRQRRQVRLPCSADPDNTQLQVRCPINSLMSRFLPARHNLSRS